ncbi:MAG TPA: hypothetical protein VFX30_09080 [bacterium]|nr:hypothetical protein [bacterium]
MKIRHLGFLVCALAAVAGAEGCAWGVKPVVAGTEDVSVSGETPSDEAAADEPSGEAAAPEETPDPAPADEVCGNGLDDDGNGAADCADIACFNEASCNAAPPPPKEICDDHLDDDGDGDIDCKDADCDEDESCKAVKVNPHQHIGDAPLYRQRPIGL